MEGLERLRLARLRLLEGRPYLGYVLWALDFVARPGLGTLGVDRRFRLYFDPEAVGRWTLEELSGLLYHEAWHLLADHAGRRDALGAEPGRWNVAADLAVNSVLRAEGIKLPGGVLYPESFNLEAGLTAEEYYELLPQGAGGEGAGPASGRCGSCAAAFSPPWEEGLEAGGISEVEAGLLRQETARAISEHFKARGDLPAELRRWADNILKPRVDWRRVLGRLVREVVAWRAGQLDYTYARPSRRAQAVPGVVLPAMRAPVPEVAVVVDTSGSVGGAELGRALAEVGGILKGLGLWAGVRVLCVDAKVHWVRRVFDPGQIRPVGGGGTDMRVGIGAAVGLKPRPDVVVVLTDGHTPWPGRSPGVPVVVGLLPGGLAEGVPGWARLVKIED
jgi:predicted metal-dependent peptidase